MDYVDCAVHPFVCATQVRPFDHPDRVAHNPYFVDREVGHEACGVLSTGDETDAGRKQIVGNKLYDRRSIGGRYGARCQGRQIAVNYIPRGIENQFSIGTRSHPVELNDDVSQLVEDDGTVKELKLRWISQTLQHSAFDGQKCGRSVAVEAEYRAGNSA